MTKTIILFSPKIEYDVDSVRNELPEEYKDFHIIHERFRRKKLIRIVICFCKNFHYLYCIQVLIIENKYV